MSEIFIPKELSPEEKDQERNEGQKHIPQYRFSIIYLRQCADCGDDVAEIEEFFDSIVVKDRLDVKKKTLLATAEDFQADGISLLYGNPQELFWIILGYTKVKERLDVYEGNRFKGFTENHQFSSSLSHRGKKILACIKDETEAQSEYDNCENKCGEHHCTGGRPKGRTIFVPTGVPVSRIKSPLEQGFPWQAHESDPGEPYFDFDSGKTIDPNRPYFDPFAGEGIFVDPTRRPPPEPGTP